MTLRTKNPFLASAMIAGLCLMSVVRAHGQTLTTLHSFDVTTDGGSPLAGLLLSNNTLYGTAFDGGTTGNGTVYKLNTDGTGFMNLHSFTNIDGAEAYGGLALSGNTLYGTTEQGGITPSLPFGTVFSVNTDGTGFADLNNFTFAEGIWPYAGLVSSGNALYGTTEQGGHSGAGTIFAINTDGTGFTILYSFTGGSDGGHPNDALILSGNTLYGTARYGGSSGYGTVFALNTDGTGFTNLYDFSTASGNAGNAGTNSDGAFPDGGLILAGNTLYGTTEWGGVSGFGTIFSVNTDGTGFANLHTFTALPSGPPYANSDGASPFSGLAISGNTLYGTAKLGGNSAYGTVFALNTDGTGFTNLYNFTGGSDGANPYAGVIFSGNTLYGTAHSGGSLGAGTVFSLSLGSTTAPVPPPTLTISHSGPNIILTWPASATGYTLQSSTNLVSPRVWNTVSTPPVVVNGQNTVTNFMPGAWRMFRLTQ